MEKSLVFRIIRWAAFMCGFIKLGYARKKCTRTCELDELAMSQRCVLLPSGGNHPHPPPNKCNASFGQRGLAIVNATFFVIFDDFGSALIPRIM